MTDQEFDALLRQVDPSAYQATLDGETQWYGNQAKTAPLLDLRQQLMNMNRDAGNGLAGSTISPERVDQIIRDAARGGFTSFDADFGKYATPQELAGFQGWNDYVDRENADVDLMTYAPLFGGAVLGAGALGAFGGAGAAGGVGGTAGGLSAADAALIDAANAGLWGGAEAGAGAAAGGGFIGGASGGGSIAGEGALSGLAGGGSGAGVSGAVGGGTLSGGAAAGAGALTQAAGSAMSRILDGTATAADWTSVLGAGASAGLGVAGSIAQGNSYENVADKYLALGAPYRDKLLETYQPGYSIANSPDFMNALDVGAQAAARATSAKSGNPVDNPGAYAEMQKYISGSLALPQLNTTRSQLGTFGQLGVNTAGTNDTAAAGTTTGAYNALGTGLAAVTRPDDPYRGALSQMLLNSSKFLA